MTEREVIEGFKIDNALLGENESGTVERNNIAIKCIEELQEYRSICDSPEKLKLIDALYLERCEEINMLKAELEEYKKLEEEGHLLKLQINKGDIVFEVSEEGIEECEVEVLFISDYTDKNGTYCNMAKIYYLREDYPYSSTEIYFTDIGKKVFLTREEAEQALADMKGK